MHPGVGLPTGGSEYRESAYSGVGQRSGQCASYWNVFLLPPTNEVCEGYVFTGVCLSTGGDGLCGCWGDVCVVARGACMVARGCAWLPEDMHGCWRVCVVARGMCGCWGACMVARGTCMVAGGMRGWQGVYMIAGGVHAWLLGGGHAW